MITYPIQEGHIFSYDDETKGASNVLKWAYEQYKEEIVYACSFGIEGIVLIDLISRVQPNAKIVFLDTALHFAETYEVIEKIKARFPSLQIIMQKPLLTLEQQKEQYGDELWKTNPNKCCEIRKVLPLEQALKGKPAWISGLRREQSSTRSKTEFLNNDDRFQSIKVCPLIHWTGDDIWNYVRENDLPYNALHDQNYPSIGCYPCTNPVSDPKDERSGRWSGMEKTECGLHWDNGKLKGANK